MEKLIRPTCFLFMILLVLLLTGCSYNVSSKNSYLLKGENDEWAVECQLICSTTFPTDSGKRYAQNAKTRKITATYKKDLSELNDIQLLEFSYRASFGSSGSDEITLDSTLSQPVFEIGGGTSSFISELYGSLAAPQNFFQAMLIFGSYSSAGIEDGYIDVTIKTDGATQEIQLIPVTASKNQGAEINNHINFFQQLPKQLKNMKVPSYYFSELNYTKPQLELIKANTKVSDRADSEFPWLEYEIVLRNTGKTQIGNFNRLGNVDIQIVPGEQLKRAMRETIGVNGFENDDNGYSHGGSGQSISDFFNIKDDCIIELSYELLAYEKENPQQPLENTLQPPVLSKADQQKLLDCALDATLVISYKGEEITSFNLNEDASGSKDHDL